MCTATCPCKTVANQKVWTDMTAAQLAPYARSQGFTFQNTLPAYSSVKECYDAVMAQAAAQGALTPEAQDRKASFEVGIAFLNYFEQEFSCSGLCRSPLFYWTRPLTEGKPA